MGGQKKSSYDAHVAMLLGAARMLQDDLQGTVVLVFQPAEEGGRGARKILDSGILEKVDAIFGLHVSCNNPIGTVFTRPGPILAASGFFDAVIHGKGGHAAISQHTVDPILAASSIIVSLQHLVSREAGPLESQVVTVGKFQGGAAFNVIPDLVTIGGTFRAFSKEGVVQLKQRIAEVIKAQAAVHWCSTSVGFNTYEKPFYPSTVNDKILHKFFQSAAGDMLGTKGVLEMQPLMGAEDFAFYVEAIPGYFYFLGMQNETQGKLEPLHSPYFRVNEDALPFGTALHASLVIRYLLEHAAKITSVKQSFHDEM